MNEEYGTGWKHPGMRSADYSKSRNHDHDRRSFAATENMRGKGPRGYSRRDSSIHDEVCEILKWSPDVDASEIEVSVNNGIVNLEGFVDSRHAKKLAERLIENVSGVQDVNNKLIMKQNLDLEEDKIIARGDEGLFSQEIVQK